MTTYPPLKKLKRSVIGIYIPAGETTTYVVVPVPFKPNTLLVDSPGDYRLEIAIANVLQTLNPVPSKLYDRMIYDEILLRAGTMTEEQLANALLRFRIDCHTIAPNERIVITRKGDCSEPMNAIMLGMTCDDYI